MSETKEIIGVIEKYNQTEGKLPGILIEGKWYNADKEDTKEVEAMKDNIGGCLKMRVANGKFIKKLELIDIPNKGLSNAQVSYDKQKVIEKEWAFGQALNCVLANKEKDHTNEHCLREAAILADDIILKWLNGELVHNEEI